LSPWTCVSMSVDQGATYAINAASVGTDGTSAKAGSRFLFGHSCSLAVPTQLHAHCKMIIVRITSL
jgi:hypothetical protein